MRNLKRILLTMGLVLGFATTSFAASGTNSTSFTINAPPIVVTKNADLSLNLTKQAGVTHYTDADGGWSLVSPAQFQVSADYSTGVNLSVTTTVSLTKGADTASMDTACRQDPSTYPANKNAGTACGTSGTTSATGLLHLSVFPISIDFSAGNAQGLYLGTITTIVTYQ